MIQAILAVLTVASALGIEAPELIKPFTTVEACLIEAQKQNQENNAELQKQAAGFVCLVIKEPTI